MSSLKNVQDATARFFSLHWCEALGMHPEWSEAWDMKAGHPNAQYAGCYLLIDANGKAEYIGVSLRNGVGSLAVRLTQHVIKTLKRNGPYAVREDKWETVRAAHIIAFPRDHDYLALALEAFLVRTFSPRLNRLKFGGAQNAE